jgi:hypothetical protein
MDFEPQPMGVHFTGSKATDRYHRELNYIRL